MGYIWLVKFMYILLYAIKMSTSFALFTTHDLTHYINFRVNPAQQVPSITAKKFTPSPNLMDEKNVKQIRLLATVLL